MCLNTPLLHHLIVKNQSSFRLILFRSSLSLGASRLVATWMILAEPFSSSIIFFILFFQRSVAFERFVAFVASNRYKYTALCRISRGFLKKFQFLHRLPSQSHCFSRPTSPYPYLIRFHSDNIFATQYSILLSFSSRSLVVIILNFLCSLI